MKLTTSLFVFFILIPFFALSQVGIGTTSPNAQLEIQSSNQAAPSNTDGIIIPKVDEFPAINPTVAQDGMQVFATGIGAPTKGFYYWDNTGTSWQSVNGADELNDLNDGKSDGSSLFLGDNSGNSDDGTNNDNTGVGVQALRENTSGRLNVAIGNGALLLNTTGLGNVALGRSALIHNDTHDLNTAIGHQVLYWNEGDMNVGLGYNSFLHKRLGTYSVALGALSGQYASGDNNVFLGAHSGGGTGLHTKSGSVFIGFSAGYNELSSDKLYIENSNSASPLIYGEFDTDLLRINGTFQIGDPSSTGYALPNTGGTSDQVLKSDGAGSVSWVNVTSFGSEKIDDLTDGKANTASTSIYFGANAGTATTDTNTGNISMGRNTLSSLTTGGYNVAIGDLALEDITNGSSNVALGNYAMTNRTSGNLNTALGSHSQFWNFTGTENSSVGHRALYGNDGDYNTAIGSHAGHSSSMGSNNVFIGYSAGYWESTNNKLYIENTDADADNSLVYGEFDTDLFRVNGSLEISNPVGSGLKHFEVRSNGNSYFGGGSNWYQNDTSGALTASIFNIGDDGLFAVSYNGVLNHLIYGAGTTNFNSLGVDVDFQISGDSNANLFYLDASTDNIGIRTAAPLSDIHLKESSLAANGGGGIAIESSATTNNWRIYHSGSHFSFAENGVRRAYITAATGAYVVTSDKNLKKNISEVKNILPKLSKIATYAYHYKDQDATAKKTLGVMAQEVQPHFPELVETNEDGNLGMNYAGLSVVAIQAIKEQQVQIEVQQKEIDELKSMVSQLLQKNK